MPREPSARQAPGENASLPDGSHDLIAGLAAKARLAEALAQGDLRLLVSEVREGLEALAGPVGEVVPFAGWKPR